MSEATFVGGIPFELTPSVGSTWRIDSGAGTVAVTAAPRSDLFVDPGSAGQASAKPVLNAVTLMGQLPDGDFQFSGRLSVDFTSDFDAGVLLVWFDERHWAKLCFEFSPDREPMVVSVVTRDVSDDANAFIVEGNTVWLRVSRVGKAYAFHASSDGMSWRLVRVFALDLPGAKASVGLEAQSPTGDGCEVSFADLSFTSGRLSNLRDGS